MGKNFIRTKLVKNVVLGVERVISVFFPLYKKSQEPHRYQYNPVLKLPKLKRHHIVIMGVGFLFAVVFTLVFFNQSASQTSTYAEYQDIVQDTYLDTGFWTNQPTDADIQEKLY